MLGRYTRATALRQRKLAKVSLQLAHVILLRCSCVVVRLMLGVAGGKGGAIGRIFAIHDRPWVAGSHGKHIEGGGERWRKEGREEVRRQFKVLGPPSLSKVLSFLSAIRFSRHSPTRAPGLSAYHFRHVCGHVKRRAAACAAAHKRTRAHSRCYPTACASSAEKLLHGAPQFLAEDTSAAPARTA
jgi:hypothetical protein